MELSARCYFVRKQKRRCAIIETHQQHSPIEVGDFTDYFQILAESHFAAKVTNRRHQPAALRTRKTRHFVHLVSSYYRCFSLADSQFMPFR